MITETILEMHFHRPLMDLFRETFGVGPGGAISFYKYSPQKERFIGFDQAYVRTELTEDDFFAMLKASATGSTYKLPDAFVGYFLQFKVVKAMQKKTRYTPSAIRSKPHYRIDLSTAKDVKTGISQHELLYNLAHKNEGAMVYYACPMLFDRASIYDVLVDLDSLHLADLMSCPAGYADNDNHYIYFDSVNAPPVWCSEPVEGKAIKPRDLVAAAVQKLRQENRRQSASDLLRLLTDIESAGLTAEAKAISLRPLPSILPLVGESLMIVRVSGGAAQQNVAADGLASASLRQARG